LQRFFTEVLDANKNVVFSQYHGGAVGNGVVLTFTPPPGTVGRFARVRFEDSYNNYLHISELEVLGYPIELPAAAPEIIELARDMPATASSVLGNNPASKSNDGNFNNIHHSQCGDVGGPWWMVDLKVESFIQYVSITNRKDCCGGRLKNALVEILDEDQNPVESRTIVGAVGNGAVVHKVFNEDTSFGRFIKVSMPSDCLHMAEVQVFGYRLMAVPTTSPTPTLVNLSLGKTATQSSSYRSHLGADKAVDGVDSSFTHTHCWQGIQQWWKVDLAAMHTILSMRIVNRLDCCGGRLHDFTIEFLDSTENVVDSIFHPGHLGSSKTISVNFVQAQYVRIVLGDQDCLQLGEVEVMGF
jgi:hypothetical protein